MKRYVVERGNRMSIWYEINNSNDIDISEDGLSIEIDVTEAMSFNDSFGNTYLEIPLKLIADALGVTVDDLKGE